MIKSIGKLTLVTILAAVVLGLPVAATAQDKTTPAPPAAPATPSKAVPIRGKLEAVDKVNMTITVGVEAKHVITVTSTTKISKGGKPATLEDGVVGEDVYASCIKSGDGADAKYTARSVRFGAAMKKTDAAPAAPAPPK